MESWDITQYSVTPCSNTPFFSLKLDLYIHSGRDIELAQGIDRLLRRLENIEEPFVRANLELIARFFIDVGRSIDGESFDPSGQRNRPCYPPTGAPHRLDNLSHRLVQHAVVIGFEPNPNLLIHKSSTEPPSNLAIIPSATAAGTGS